MNEIARVTVENHLYIQREEAWKARDGAIKNGRNKEYIQMWDDIGNLYDKLLKQVENMKSLTYSPAYALRAKRLGILYV